MRPICVVATCAPRSRIDKMRSLRCSAAPSIWTTCAPNLSLIPSTILLCGLAQIGLDHPRVVANFDGRTLSDLLAVVEDDDAL